MFLVKMKLANILPKEGVASCMPNDLLKRIEIYYFLIQELTRASGCFAFYYTIY